MTEKTAENGGTNDVEKLQDTNRQATEEDEVYSDDDEKG